MLNEFWLRLKALLLRKKFDRDLEDEVSFHLAMQEDRDNSPERNVEHLGHEAALRQFGNPTRTRENLREMRSFMLLETLWQDIRFGARLLRKNPVFSLIAIITLGLGIGANTAIFSLTYQVLLQMLPVPHPKELVVLRSPGPKSGRTESDGDDAFSFSYPVYKDLRERGGRVFAGLLARKSISISISGPGGTERAAGELVTGNYFETLGVVPALGRTLSSEDETAPGANPVAVLSYGFWTRRFGNDPSILNKQINVNGTPLTVVGVSRAGFSGVQLGELPDIFVPITMTPQMIPNWPEFGSHKMHWLAIMGRLQPGLSAKTGEAAVQTIFHPILEAEVPLEGISQKTQPLFLARKLELKPGAQGRPNLQDDAGKPLIFLNAMVGLVLLIACANLASLLIAKGEARQREIAVRMSLGAKRSRVLRQLLTEGALLALAGGLLGIFIAVPLLRLIVRGIPDSVGIRGMNGELDYHMLGYAILLSLATTLLFALMPALRLVRVDPQLPLREQSAAAGASGTSARKWLIVSQVVLTTVLLAGAGLFAKSLYNIERVDLGLVADHVIQFVISPELNRYTPAKTADLFEQLRKQLSAMPGIQSVSAAEVRILSDSEDGGSISVEGYQPHGDEVQQAGRNWVGPDYFATMKIPLLAGREFRESDTSSSTKVAIINEKFARHYFSGRDPLGQHLIPGGGPNAKPDIEIVGIVRDSKHNDSRDEISSFVYMPYTQRSTLGHATFYVRTRQDPLLTANLLRKTVAGIDPNLPVFNLMTLTEQVNDTNFSDRVMAFLSMCMGALAALLAALGLYGVMAYMVARRTREIGIRMALGASRESVAWMILREVMRLTFIGLAVGLVGALIAGHFAESQLFGVKGYSPLILGATALLLIAVAALAGSLPARRAARVQPMIALRYE
jgi:putative ABC transport system permease protein